MPIGVSRERWRAHWQRQWKITKMMWIYAAIVAPLGFLINWATTVTATSEIIALHAIAMFFIAPICIIAMHLGVETALTALNLMPETGAHQEIGLRIACQTLGLVATLFLTVALLERLTPLRDLMGGPLMSAVALVLSLLVILTLYDGFRMREIALLRFRSLQAEARYQSLNEQVQPHFLFNALNVLAEVVYQDQEKGATGILALAHLYEKILEVSQEKFITVRDEFRLIEDYLHIQRLRFGDRFTANTTISEAAAAQMLPPFSVFNLVENAIKHGVAKSLAPIVLTLNAATDKDGLHIIVSHSRSPSPATRPADESRPGKGLQNIRERLAIAFRNRASLDLQVTDSSATASLHITHT